MTLYQTCCCCISPYSSGYKWGCEWRRPPPPRLFLSVTTEPYPTTVRTWGGGMWIRKQKLSISIVHVDYMHIYTPHADLWLCTQSHPRVGTYNPEYRGTRQNIATDNATTYTVIIIMYIRCYTRNNYTYLINSPSPYKSPSWTNGRLNWKYNADPPWL